jgi:outer membrane usher protein
VVRDAFGETREFSAGYYLSTSTLGAGVHDYQYSVGWRREDVGARSWHYTTPALLARHRTGVTNWLTVGARLEAVPGVASGGLTANLRLPLGQLEVAAARSQAQGVPGTALAAAYAYHARVVGAGVAFEQYAPSYATVDPPRGHQRTRQQLRGFVSVPVAPKTRLTLRHTRQRFVSDPAQARSELVVATTLTGAVSLSVSAADVRDERGRRAEAFVGLSVPFGRTVVAAAATTDGGRGAARLEVSRSRPVGIGYGYQLVAERGEANSYAGTFQYQGPYGRYEVWHDRLGGRRATRLQAAGALVAIGGRVHVSQPVQRSYALVRVPGVEGVRAFVSHQEVGRTDARGELLVPNLEPYYGNLLSIADQDVPLDHSIVGGGMTLAPSFRGGALAEFRVTRTWAVMGRLLIGTATGDEEVPSYGQLVLRVPGGALESPIGADGEFYVENPPSGAVDAEVQYEGGVCRFTVVVPAAADEWLRDIGVVRCDSSTP